MRLCCAGVYREASNKVRVVPVEKRRCRKVDGDGPVLRASERVAHWVAPMIRRANERARICQRNRLTMEL
jgi:hypothetical protein